MADISKITLPSGDTYDIKDADARERLELIEAELAGLTELANQIDEGMGT